jgi:subtilisin family serine protease
MKKFLLLIGAILCSTLNVFSQSTPPSQALLKDGMVKWREHEMVIRFSDNLKLSFNQDARTGIRKLDDLLEKFHVREAKQLFPVQKPIPDGKKSFTTYTGQVVDYPKLTNIYVLKFDTLNSQQSVFQVIEAFQQLKDFVVYAEPNYLFEIDSNPNDTLYQFQYNANQMNVDSVWSIMQDSGVSDQNIVIAIIDTGVDTNHVDLHGKQYFNMIEANGLAGVDDDNNGFIDDLSGWDFVNNDKHPADDNSHGTHCAGIAVAAHNQIGIAGISKGAKYLPVKGLESSGGSSASVLAQAVVYSANNGADILSMSFGGYGRSLALENALAYAYAFSLPVGAAGNDGLCIRNDGFPCPDGRWPAPMYPGAYTFVLAAQATQQNPGWNGYRVWFSNYDFDGPTYTDYGDEFNYEVYAPGTYIVSTIPGGGYTTLSGTSMACPAVAGSAAMYMAFRPNNTKEKLFIDYIMSWYDVQGTFTKNQGGQFPSMDLYKAIWPDERPLVWTKSNYVVDSINGDGDGKLDAGELLSLRVDVKNLGSFADSIYVGLRVSQFEDPSVIDLIDSVSFIGALSSYASGSNNTNMFDLRVDSNVVNGRNISLNVFAWTPGGDTTSQDFVLQAQAGCEYNGIYPGKTIWDAACGIIVTGNTFCDTLIVRPGTVIQMDANVGIAYNHLVCQGTPDSMILFTKNFNDYQLWSGITSFRDSALIKYTIFEYGWPRTSQQLVGPGNKVSFEDCVFRYNEHYYGNTYTGNHITLQGSKRIERCVFEYNSAQSHIIGLEDDNWTGVFRDNVFSGNLTQNGIQPLAGISIRTPNDLSRIRGNSFLRHRQQLWAVPNHNPTGYPIGVRWSNGGGANLPTFTINYLDSNYYGFTNVQAIESSIYDFTENPVFAVVNGSQKALSRGTRRAHGHVVNIKLNNQNINIINNPIHTVIGPGKHEVKVEFNRPMDVSITPFVAYGVRMPYTQNVVNDSSYWSADSTVWTSFLNITQTTASDGFNRISVRNAKDNEHFAIPIEDYRFEFRLNVAGALSTGFNAIGDSSEIRLNWTRPDSIIDLLGYNIYRVDTTFDANGDGKKGDTVLINSSLVLDTLYTDENVIGGKFYRYHYTALRSSLTQSQMSVGVWCTPYAAAPRVRTKKATQSALGSITFQSDIDANFIATTGRFQFGTNKNNLNNSTQWGPVGSSYQAVPYQTSIQSVQPGMVYYYRVQGQNSLGVRTGQVDSILSKSVPQIQITAVNQPCIGSTVTPAVLLTSPDTTITLSYQVNGGPVLSTLPSLTVTNASPMVFSVTASGLYSQATTESITITPMSSSNAPVNLTVSGSTTFCVGGTVTLSAPSGVSSVVWSSGQTGNSLVVSTTGTYTATYVTTNGCTVTSNPISVVVNPLPQPVISTSNGLLFYCAGTSLQLNASGGAAGYQWFRNGIAVAGATSSSLAASLPGAYTVRTTTASGCMALSAAVQVSEVALPTATISNSANGTLCAGGTAILTAPSGFSYLWSNGATTQSINVTSSGSYSVVVTNASGCSTQSAPVQMVFNPLPAMSVSASGPLSLCANSAVTLTAAPGFASYLWSNGATTQSVIATSTGSYTVTGFTSAGCQATSAATAVTVNALPVATITANGSTTLCAGGQVTLSAPSGMSYLWSNGATTQSITVTQAGNYTVQVTNASGCQATSAATAVTVNALPVATITANGPTAFCPGDSVQLSAAVPQGTIVWSTGSTASSIWVKTAGTYSVTVTDNGCSASSNTVTVNVLPQPTTPMVYYSNNANLLISSAPLGNQWILNGVDIPGADSTTWYPTLNGLYAVRVTNASGCASESDVFNYVNIGTGEAVLNAVSIYPNPTTGMATIELPEADVLIRVYDGIGRLVLEGQSSDTKYLVDLTRFASGVYRVSVQWQDGTETISLIKN